MLTLILPIGGPGSGKSTLCQSLRNGNIPVELNHLIKLDDIFELPMTSVEDAIKAQPTLYLARKKYVEIEQQCHSVKEAMESLNKAIKWNGQDIFDEMVGNKIKVSSLNLTHLHKSGYRSKAETNKDPEFVPFRRDTRFVIDDLPRGGMTRIRNTI